jgi:hypothetical protein
MVNKDWTFEEALNANQVELNKTPGRSSSDPTLPLFQWWTLSELEHCRENFDSDPYWLMTAIRLCANHELPLPEWAATAYIKAYDDVHNARKKSWDEVFGKPYEKGSHLNAIRKERNLEFDVLNSITNRLREVPPPAIDCALFEEIGKDFNIGKTLASKYYYAAKERLNAGHLQVHVSADSIEITTCRNRKTAQTQ